MPLNPAACKRSPHLDQVAFRTPGRLRTWSLAAVAVLPYVQEMGRDVTNHVLPRVVQWK